MFTPKMLGLALRYQVVAGLVFVAVSATLWPSGSTGVLSGVLLAAVNFWFLQYAVSKLFVSEKPNLLWAVLLGFKFVAVLGAMAVLVLVARVHPLGMALGLFSLFIGIGFGTGHTMTMAKPNPQR